MNRPELTQEIILIDPQPQCGRPFRINFQNRGPEYWYNERRAYRDRQRGPMLFEWKCPFGQHGTPELINGLWYWVKKDDRSISS
jgi:hypothetical protein